MTTRKVSFVAVTLALVVSAPAAANEKQACGDAYKEAQSLRDDHKLLRAREQLRVCGRAECPGFIAKDCTSWLADVEAAIPSVVFEAKDASGNDRTDVQVRSGDTIVGEQMDGKPVSLDPGKYTFVFEAADGTKAEVELVLGQGEKDRHVAATVGKPAPPPPAPLPVSATVPPPETAAPAPAESGVPWKTIGLVTAGVGVVGLGVGSVFGIQAISKKSTASCDSNSLCPNGTAEGTLRDAQSAGNTSTIFFVLGGVLAAGGITMWALAPSARVQAAPTVGSSGGGVVVKGTW